MMICVEWMKQLFRQVVTASGCWAVWPPTVVGDILYLLFKAILI